MARIDKPRQLIVEGQDDLFAVVGLMRSYCEWPQRKEEAPVWIVPAGGVTVILEPGYLSAFIKVREIQSLGVILDADDEIVGRYASIRNQFLAFFPDMPTELPAEGLILANEEGKRFGLWIMPDNESPGSLEVFLRYLVPNESQTLWKHAEDSVDRARTIGAPCRDPHIPKAQVHTWLAWQDPPGQNFGVAITRSVLDPKSPQAEPFVRWFRELFQL